MNSFVDRLFRILICLLIIDNYVLDKTCLCNKNICLPWIGFMGAIGA